MKKAPIDPEFAPIGRKGNSRLPSRFEWLVILVILGAEASCLRVAVRNAGGGTRGDPIPTELPDEAHRVRYPLGFSMVVPPRWHHSFTGGLSLFSNVNRRAEALIVVHRVGRDRPWEFERLHRTRFQGREAYEVMEVRRRDTFDDPAWSEYTLTFRRGGEWYEIKYGIAEERTGLPPMVRRYLDTFRLDDPPSKPAPGR